MGIANILKRATLEVNIANDTGTLSPTCLTGENCPKDWGSKKPLHQGESNAEDKDWPKKVKVVYDNLMKDLNLKPQSVPLLAGEVVSADQGGEKASANEIIKRLPETLPNSYVISSTGLPCNADHLHFTAEGYRQFGKRYAEKMLSLFVNKVNEIKSPTAPPAPGAWP